MSFFAVNTQLTVCWSILPTANPPVKADLDIHFTTPADAGTYTNDAVTTYTAPTATARGLVTYVFTPTTTGRYRIELSIGTDAAHVVQSIRELYIVDPPAHVIASQPKTALGPQVLPPDPEVPPGDPGTYALEDLAFLDIQTVSSAELSGNTGNGILDGWYQTWYILDAGVPAQSVPLSWGDYQEFGSIQEAFEHSTAKNFRWGFLNVPQIAGEDDPYSMFDNYNNPPVGEMNTSMEHVFPGETRGGTFFTVAWAGGLVDPGTARFFSSAEGGSGASPTEWNVTANDNDRIGIGLVGTRLPAVSANWTDELSNMWTAGTATFRYDWCSDGTNIYVGANNTEILRSTDGGTTFANCFDLGGVHTFTKITAGGGIVMAISSAERVFTSSNGGTNWVDRGLLPTTGSVNTLMFFDGTTDYFIVGGFLGGQYRLYRSTDGVTWTEFGTSIASNVKKGFPFIGDIGSGNEIFLGYQASAITRMAPTDANETAYQSPPSATDIRGFYVESGLTVFYDQTNGMIGYNGTTEYTHSVFHDVQAYRFGKDGTNIFAPYLNTLVYGTAAEWLTTDGMSYSKMPCSYDESVLKSGEPVKHGTDWIYAFRFKGKVYTNTGGI